MLDANRADGAPGEYAKGWILLEMCEVSTKDGRHRICPNRSLLVPFSWLLRRGFSSASLIRRLPCPHGSENALNDAFDFASRVIFCIPER